MMKFLRYWVPVAIVAGSIFLLSSMPQSELPLIDLPGLDKLAHLIIYTCLGFVFGRALTSQLRSEASWVLYRNRLMIAALLSLAYGITDEWHQQFTPGRSVEVMDLVMDGLGGFIGAGLVLFYRAWVIDYEKKTNDRAA